MRKIYAQKRIGRAAIERIIASIWALEDIAPSVTSCRQCVRRSESLRRMRRLQIKKV